VHTLPIACTNIHDVPITQSKVIYSSKRLIVDDIATQQPHTQMLLFTSKRMQCDDEHVHDHTHLEAACGARGALAAMVTAAGLAFLARLCWHEVLFLLLLYLYDCTTYVAVLERMSC
jgi:hypothetical protein